MSGSSYVLDTNIISLFLKGDRKLLPYFNHTIIHISFITELELKSISGLSNVEEKSVLSFIDTCIITDVNSFIKETAVVFRGKYKMQLPDAIIGATAAYLGYTLITADKSFSKLPLPIIIYSK